ncbi:DUF1127 domain-containing protein [Rhodovulum steppense]|uniref:Uncharacterized protein YjiS (DUF1127 family) n=1 Tax=Rhodovulum steppense TaxID=540251 RepID=A0A4R1YUA5_9RHOB|nr:DUF1127 domain-containing protein [Rhodovulum steppense]TCM84416.1 uncharacterized protein YjiS (DUF1127 family) [Rhodovulum steppense]
MTVIPLNRRPPATHHPSGGLRAQIAGLVGRLAAWNDARATRKLLSRLSDRELDDIGLNRAEIDRIARRAPSDRRAAM